MTTPGSELLHAVVDALPTTDPVGAITAALHAYDRGLTEAANTQPAHPQPHVRCHCGKTYIGPLDTPLARAWLSAHQNHLDGRPRP